MTTNLNTELASAAETLAARLRIPAEWIGWRTCNEAGSWHSGRRFDLYSGELELMELTIRGRPMRTFKVVETRTGLAWRTEGPFSELVVSETPLLMFNVMLSTTLFCYNFNVMLQDLDWGATQRMTEAWIAFFMFAAFAAFGTVALVLGIILFNLLGLGLGAMLLAFSVFAFKSGREHKQAAAKILTLVERAPRL